MTGNETIVFGIPVPSTDPVFIAIVVIHIFLGLTSVISGLVAMSSRKGKGTHSRWGKIYFSALSSVFITVVPLAIMRWPLNNHLLILGAISFLSAYWGKRIAQRQIAGWPRRHTILMGASYIFLLTAFYVDNGKNLPLWKLLPQYSFWILPSIIGAPLILYSLFRHPLNTNPRRVD